MNSDTAEKPPRVLLDTNILISALIYGGKPEEIYNLVLDKKITAITSPILLTELAETLIKKFKFESDRIKQLEKITKNNFTLIEPDKIINLVKDDDDNRVLEAALEGKCSYIITGDRDLLDLKTFKNIKIVTPDIFLSENDFSAS